MMDILVSTIPIITRDPSPPTEFDRYIVWKIKYERIKSNIRTLRMDTNIRELDYYMGEKDEHHSNKMD